MKVLTIKEVRKFLKKHSLETIQEVPYQKKIRFLFKNGSVLVIRKAVKAMA